MKSRRYVALAVAGLLALAGTAPPARAATAPAWAQQGYGPGYTNYNPHESKLNASTIARLKPRWKIKATSGSPHCAAALEPIVAGNRLFTIDPGGIGAYDTRSGARTWHVDLANQEVRSTALSNGLLLVHSVRCQDALRFRGYLSAYDPATGALTWQRALGSRSFDMSVDQGVIALDGSIGAATFTTGYRVGDGEQLWQINDFQRFGSVSAGGRLLLRGATNHTMAVSIRTGAVLWQNNQDWYAVGSDPVGSRFYVQGNTVPGLTAVDAATGEVIWQTNLPTAVGKIASDGRRLFYSYAKSIRVLDARTGRKVYSVHVPAYPGNPVRAGGLGYVTVGDRGPLVVFDAATGKRRPTTVRGTYHWDPVVVGGKLYVLDEGLRAYGI